MALVQTCDVDEDEASYFLTAVDDQTITKSLYNANGKCGDVGVSATKDVVTKCDFSTRGEPVPVSFRVGHGGPSGYSKQAVVVDMDAICYKNNRYGIVVATNIPSNEDDVPETGGEDDASASKKDKARHYNPVGLYVENYMGEFKLQRRIKVYGEITCMRVLVSPVDMPSQRPFLSAKIAAWPNIVAIGCQRSSCFLGQFSDFDPEKREHWKGEVIEVAATTDALKSLVGTNGRFNYHCGGASSWFPKDDEHVSAVSYIPCYAVVLVGLSNGCIVMVPLDGKSCISCLTVPYSTRINHLVVLEPEFDPAGGFYIFSARERPQVTHKNAMLVVFSHKISRAPDGDGGYEYQDMNSVMMPMRDGAYWLNVHGVVKKRKRREADTSNDCSAENSQLPDGLNTTQHMYSDGMERTLLFYSYITLTGQMKGGLFDLNSFYSRRCATQQVRFDEYGQDPICSQYTLTVPSRNTGTPLFRAKDISWVHCQNITRYTSPLFDREPLFQPMAAALSLTIHVFGKYAYAATVDSLQYTVLDRIARSLPVSLSQPDFALALLERTGLVLAPTTKRERLRMEERPATERVPSELDKIMRAIVSDIYTRRQLLKFIEECKDRKQLLHVGRWMFNELREMVVRMDESIAPLFDAVAPEGLSKDAQEIRQYCPDFFEFAELVFWKVRGRGQELGNDTPRLRWVRKAHALMAFDLRLFLFSVKWFTMKLPMSEGWTTDLLDEVAEINHERSERARRESHPLFLDALLTRLHDKTMEDPLWDGLVEPAQWYPPTRFHLLSLLRQNEPALADRAALVFYYLLDAEEAVRREEQRSQEHKRGYPVKDSLVHSFLIWEAGKMVDRQGCEGVRERWEADWKGRPAKENRAGGNGQQAVAATSRLTEAEKDELTTLFKAPFRKLQRVDEDRMKVLLNKQDFGIYRFNVYLIKKGRFPEVEDLPVPGPNEPFPHVVVAEYAKYKALALAQKAQLPPPTFSNAFACPYVITKADPKPAAHSPDTTANASRIVRTGHVTIRGKTPKKLNIFKRLTTGTAAAAAAAQCTPPSRSAQDEASTEREMARINALLKTPSMRFRNQQEALDEEEEREGRENDSDMAPDEMARVREALRTPRSRATAVAARAAAAAGEGTPEGAHRPAMTVPTSILKSARKESRLPQSVTKSKLRFAQVFEEKSISPRERDNSASSIASMSQPNFDDSFDDEHVLSKSSVEGSSASALNTTTRLEREIEEEELAAKRRRDEAHEVSMESDDLPQLSSGGEEEEEVTDEGGEERMEEEEEGSSAAAGGGATFQIYHNSDAAAASTDDEAEVAFVQEDDHSAAAAAVDAAGDEPKEGQELAKEDEEARDEEKEEDEMVGGLEDEKDEGSKSPVGSREEPDDKEEEEEHAAPAAACPTPPTTAAADAFATPATPPTPAAAATSNETFTVVANATFVVDVREDVGGEEEEVEAAAAADAAGEEEEAAAIEEEQQQPAAAEAAAPTPPEEQMEEEEAIEPNLSCAATPENEEEKEEEREDEEEEEEEGPPPPAVAAGDEAAAVVDEEEEKEAEEKENVSRAATPVNGEEEEEREEEQQEEEEAAAPAAAPAAATRPPPPRPKPRTVFPNRIEPISLGLRSYIYMEDGVEKSFEEQRDTDSDEDGEHGAKPILARLPPPPASPRRSSSRLQQHRGGEEAAAATTPPAAVATAGSSATRKRGASRSRKDVAGPSTSSPRGKKERRDEEEEKEKEKKRDEQEEQGHMYTTTRTRVIEERYVEREDGVMQHTVKQSTNVIETTDGVVVKTEREHRETIEEEGDREEKEEEGEEMMDEEDRATPPMAEAAAEPETSRRSSSRTAAASRSRTLSTGSKSSKKEEEKEKKREEKESTPLRSPARSMKRRTLMRKEEEEEGGEERMEEEKKQEEPLTPRRSMRAHKPSESSAASQAVTPTKSTRRKSGAAKTPSREPSAVPASPRRRLRLDETTDEEKERKKEEATVPPSTPGKRGRPRKEPITVAAVAAASVDMEKKEEEQITVAAPTPSKRGRPRKEPVVEDAAAAAAAVAAPPVPAKRKTTIGAGSVTVASRRTRCVSESVHKKKEEKEDGEEEEVDAIAALRRRREQTKAEVIARREENAKRKTGRGVSKLGAIPENTVAKVDVRKEKTKKKKEDEEEDQPGTSQPSAPTRRKRSLSETAVKMAAKEETIMKTPSKKKTRTTDKDDEEEEEGAGDRSILRRSSRKAAVTANDALKTPSKSARDKQ